MSSCVEVVIVGCGTPKFSMGWTHLFQMLQPPLSEMAQVVGVVEPFFLGEAGRDAKGADLFKAYAAEHSEIPFVPDISDLPPIVQGNRRVAIIAMRSAEMKRAFERVVLEAGCSAVYLEKPGASCVEEIDELISLAKERGIQVLVGYSRNCGTYVTRARAYEEECVAAGGKPMVTLIHSNPWGEDEMAECFTRCQPGMFYDMACHDLAVACAHYGLTVAYTDLKVDTATSLQATYAGITDYVRLGFSLRPTAETERINFVIDRQAGAFNGMQVGDKKFLSGEPPLLFENPLHDLSPHLAVQYDYYVEAKRILLAAVIEQTELPCGTPTLEVGREVMLLAEKLTKELKSLVPVKEQ